MASCYINPFPKEISQDEFLLILNANNLYEQYLNHINNNDDLSDFFNQNQTIINLGIDDVKGLRDFKSGKINNFESINDNKIISYYINNNVDNNVLKIIDKGFTEVYYKVISQSNAPFSELININDLVTMPYKKGVETNNVLIRFFGNLIALKLRTQEELLTNKKISGETLTENDKLFNEKLVNYLNSLGIYENPNKPLISLYNLKNNTRLKELIKFLGRDGLFRLDDNIVNNINDEIEVLEENIQIYDVDPLTEDPSDKISGRLKLMLRGIPKYDLNGNPIKVQNIPQYWKPSELIFELLKEVSNKNVHNYSLNQILDRLKILSRTTNNRLSNPAQKFLSRLEILHNNIKTFENSNLDIYTDLFLYFQQSLVGIAILEERFETISTIDRGGNLEYISVPDYKLINKTNFDNYGFTKVIEDFVLNLKTNELLKNNFNTSEELVLKPNQSINSLAEVLNNILAPSLLVNKEEFKVRLVNKLKNSITEQKGISDLKTFLKTIIRNNEVLNSDFISKVYNVNNDTLFPVISPSELSEEISLVNNSIRAVKQGVAYEDTDFYNKFGIDIVGQSLWGDYVKNAGDTLKVSIFTAYKNTETNNEFSNFTRKELLASFFNINNTPNTIHTPILSDKSNIYLIENYKFSSNVISPEEDFFSGTDALSDVSNSINFFDYIISFLKIDNDLNEKINNQNISIGKNIDNAFKIQSLFLFNPEYYGVETNENVLNLYNTYVSTSSSISEKNQAKISLIEIITEVYNKIGDNLLNEFVGNNLITFNDDKYIINPNSLISNFNYPQSVDGSDKLVDDIKKAAVKSYIFTTHLSLLTNGHPAFFKINDEQKRTKAIVADSKKVNLSAVYKGETILIDNINRRIILKDVETTVKNADLIEASLQQLKSEGLKGDELLEKMANLYSNSVLLDGTEVFTLESEKLTDIQNKFLEETKDLQEQLETIKDPTSEKYKELTNEINDFKEKYSKLEKEVKFVKSQLANTTDASSLMSLDFSRKYHIGLNLYSNNQEELYKAEKSGKFLKNFTKDNFKIIKNIVYTKLRRNNIMTSYMEKTSTDNFTAQRVFIGNEPNIYQAMLGKMFGYTFDEKNESWSYNPNNAIVEKVVYGSAVKAEVPTKETGETIVLDLEKFIKDNKIENLEDVNNFKFNEAFSNEYVIDVTTTEDRLQVETPEHLEAQGDLGTQIDALIHNAINIEDNYKIGNKVYNGNELTVLLNDLKKSFIDIGVKNLYNKYNNNTLNTFYELISELYEQRDYLNIETLSLEKIPELLKNPQFGLALVSKIQSQIKRNVVKTKMNTFQLFNGVIGYSDDLKILVETDTDKDGNEFKKIIFEVAMPAISEDIFNTTLNSETGKLDINLLPKEIKDMVVYRIPTEAIYSMFVIRVKKLLHPSAGPIIYMPIGTTTIAGFDMDIDKLFGILKNYKLDKDNKIKVISYSLDKDSNVNFKEWSKENISLEDKASLTTFFEEKTKLIEKNKEILNTNEELKSLLERKKELVKEIKDNLVTNFNLSGSNLSKNISIQVNENKEYIKLKEGIETIINSKELKDLDVLIRDFQEIDANIQAIEKPYKDQWKQLNVTQQMSSLQLQNLNFDILTNTISNFKNINTYLTGNNFVRLEEINDINETKKIKSNPEYAKQIALNKRLPYKDRSLLNNVNTFMAIMSGAQNIGPTAIMNQFLGYLKFLQNFNQDKEFGFNFNSNVTIKSNSQKDSPYFNLFLGLNNMQTKSGQTAALANAVLLAQAVDNIKKDLSVPLNLHKNLMGLRGLLYMVGLDENVVDRLFTDVKLVDKIIKNSIANGSINKYKKNIFKIKSILDETEDNLVAIDLDVLSGEVNYSINLEDLNKSYNPEKNVLDLFTNNIGEEDIVKFLSVMFDFSSQLTDLILITNNFYTGFGKNFKELANNFLDTQEFLSKNNNLIYSGDLANNLLINTEDSFIEYKLKTLLDVTNNIYELFNINLNNLNYKNLINFFGSPSNKGYLFQVNLSANLYLNLINELGSAETLLTTYYQEVQDLKDIFSVSKLVEDSGNNEYTISPNQNLNLSILKNIIRFVNTTPYFLQTNQEISNFRSLYPFDIQFLGQTEQINTFDTPKKIIDLFSNDTQTKYATNLEGPITEDKVISAKDIAKKLFFVNMVQSALFSGKTNRGRSNMFEMLFLDNIFLQNSILHINKNYSSLINNEIVNLDYNFFQNIENANALIAFLTINNFETFSNPNVVYNLENIRFKESKTFINNSLFGQPTTFSLGQRGNLTNVISLNKNQIPITQNETFQKANQNSINKVLNKKFLIVTPEKETYSILFQKVYVQEDTYYYKKLGIINVGKLYSSKENNIAFSLLQPLLINNGIETDTIIVEPIMAPISITPTQPSTSVEEFNLADKLTPIAQNFGDGQGGQMQPQFKGKSTMDLIISGDRTRTTRANTDIQRMSKDYDLSKISDLVGKVIRMTDKTGRQVYTRITKVTPFTQEYQDATWQKEGWVKSVTDKNVGQYPYAIEFEVVNKPTQPSTQPTEEDFSSVPPCVN
jgi:hypothetical protein